MGKLFYPIVEQKNIETEVAEISIKCLLDIENQTERLLNISDGAEVVFNLGIVVDFLKILATKPTTFEQKLNGRKFYTNQLGERSEAFISLALCHGSVKDDVLSVLKMVEENKFLQDKLFANKTTQALI